MAYTKHLEINGTEIPIPQTYDLAFTSVLADTSGETEAGTSQRDVIRSGIAEISVSLDVNAVWLGRISAYSKLAKLNVRFFDTELLTLRSAEMYMDSFSASLIKDTAKKGFWNVSFKLKEM